MFVCGIQLHLNNWGQIIGVRAALINVALTPIKFPLFGRWITCTNDQFGWLKG